MRCLGGTYIKNKIFIISIFILLLSSISSNFFGVAIKVKHKIERTDEIDNQNNRDGSEPSKGKSLKENLNYFIKATDHPDVLDDLEIDNIGLVTFSKGINVSLSNVEIYLSSDMVNWIKVDIVETGLWRRGDPITLREIKASDVKKSYYCVRLLIPDKSKYPIAECMVRVDNASVDSFTDKRIKYEGSLGPGDDVGIVKSSIAYCSCDAHPDYNFVNMVLSVEFAEVRWDSEWEYWEYSFNLDGYEQSLLGNTIYMRMHAAISDDVITYYYPIAGSTGMDETEEYDWTWFRAALIVGEAALTYIYPEVTPVVTALQLVQLLRKSPDFDLEWYNSYPIDQQPNFHNCFAQMKLSIYPNSSWSVEINLETEFRTNIYDPDRYNLFLDSQDGWPEWPLDMHPYGEGKIIFQGTSPVHPNKIKEERAKAPLSDWLKNYLLVDYDFSATNFYGQAAVLSDLGIMSPTDGSEFLLMSTGIAGANPVTTSRKDPGSENGTDFGGDTERDYAELLLKLYVPSGYHCIYYDFMFFSTDYPEYNPDYTDKFIVELQSPSMGTSTYMCDVNSGNFVLTEPYFIPGTGFDIYSTDNSQDARGNEVTTSSGIHSDAGGTPIITRGGKDSHPVGGDEIVTLKFRVEDIGDNRLDTAVYLDNIVFSCCSDPPDIYLSDTMILDEEEVYPGEVVTGWFEVANIGASGSKLNWKITEWPGWGEWNFSPMNGEDLTPEDGIQKIWVTLIAPDTPNTEFQGDIKVVDKYIPWVCEYCHVTLKTKSDLPDLACEGSLNWLGVPAGSIQTGSFKVKNIGAPGSRLNWEIADKPDWGTWTFSQSSGTDLKPEDGPMIVDVTVVSPNKEKEVYLGSIKIVNQKNSDDYCNVPVKLVTPRSKLITLEKLGQFNLIFQRFLARSMSCPIIIKLTKEKCE